MLIRYCLSLLLFAAGMSTLTAQDCNYQLLMEDTFGDGWNGGELTIRINGVSTMYTLERDDNDGFFRSVFLPVNNGDVVELDYMHGGFPNETFFSILNNNDSLIYSAGVGPDEEPPDSMNIFSFVVECEACAAPAANSIEFFRVRSTSVDIRFLSLPPSVDPLYRIQYRGGDYDPAVDMDGTTITGSDTTYRINNLAPDSLYTFWIDAACQAEDDTTAIRGPFQVMTQKRKDVGVTQLSSPVTGCDLGAEDVTIGITNFGGEPQAFFNVNFTIDGVSAGVQMPNDGIYTGVVGVDSTEFFTFDIRAFLTSPGTYEFQLWTELEDDEDNSNDTLTISVTHIPLITEFPYVENFEENNGFWYSDRQGRSPSSWEWGQPQNDLIDRAPQGRNAWVTELNDDYFNQEESYLVSPCFDLSGMTTDPLFSCQLFVESEDGFDELTLEYTIDEGENWRKVETSPAGINWYNDLENQRWTGDGGFGDNFRTVANLIPGVAGERIQLRFALRTDNGTRLEGFLVDAVTLTERMGDNLAAAEAFSINPETCSSPTDSVSFRFTNLGLNTAENVNLSYRVNGGDVTTEVFAGPLTAGQTATYIFSTPFDGTTSSESTIEVWTELSDDFQLNNDTTVFYLRTREDIPFFEGFTDGDTPDGWDISDNFIADRNDDGEVTMYDNVWSLDPSMTFRTANYGLIESGDSLRFKIDLYNFGNETPYEEPTEVFIYAFSNCSQDTILIEELTVVTDTSVSISLEPYTGDALQFSFLLLWPGTGDFWANFDDIAIRRCAADLDLMADVDHSNSFGDNGVATIIPGAGLAPYTFNWSTGDSTATADSLAVGDYTVTVTDAVGCGDIITVTVDLDVAADEATELLQDLSVYPNPTSGLLELRLDLSRATELKAEVYDLTGRRMLTKVIGRQISLNEQFDFSAFPNGVYLLRLQVDNAARTIRVIKQ
ncbi:T9SS type A sorting domain-containing protein [Neolewinella aurantiaca]|uniref:T9SS type A sorting domain-containing protein n=1 Tax=Neolewinella aurantiaca TaxID=2602767 RepID=A0A5C7F4Z6_9BACT|nr:T9SS type A sorting domain-containing protein [Neolewinella aurantiaca]TXF83361.1 T9SS type A sorting domain-containing protein [Neolewinella aurantiaca]